MHAEETLVRPCAPSPDALRISAVFPPEVLEQVRGRVRLLALLILIAFAFDLVVYIGHWAAILAGYPPPDNFFETGAFQVINLAAVVASAGLWWVARSRQVSASRLHTLGLAYEIAICFIIAMITFWQYYIIHQMLPNLTWVPAVVILFPLIMPGPPRRMLAAAVAAGGMSPLALFLLNLTGKVTADPDAYFQTAVHSAIAVGFAYTGARIVYGLGREVTAARELGSYRLVERLGQGGMGEVWRAEHRMLARSAAIKLIRPSMMREGRPGASEEARHRFEREAQVIAHLRSPHTIELYDFGIAVDGAFYYWGLMWFWVIRGHATEGLRWYEQTLNLPSLPPSAESRTLVGAAAMWYTQGELERARTALTRGRALARGADDIDSVMHAEFVLGHVEYSVGNLDAAQDRFTSSLEGFTAVGKAWGTGHMLTGLAWVALATGDAGQAERLLDEAASALRQAGPWFLSFRDYIRAVLAVRRGNPDEAIAFVRESLTRIRDLQDKFAFVYALVPLAAAAALKGDDVWAARILGARDAVTDRTGATVVDKSVEDLKEQAEREVRARLGEERWAPAYEAGRKTSIDTLLKDIDAARA